MQPLYQVAICGQICQTGSSGKIVLELDPGPVKFFPIESLRYATQQELDDLHREHIQAKQPWPQSDGNKLPGISSTGAG